ncbi:MAG: Gfo/Idh/MocA family oxidoreductase [Syntrophotalea acetylenica]|uniref:UDP-N-acetyl-D-glucosamine dehydrogenase n=1 Tax=Syntrophotalea acetylenica TaxID=29542 RepID=A0A1L3GHX1_SYNAC|nr:Gfo/Idh/MocA family oxidoreductase [Syntrophotalea acetylenica]APG25489.1 UDP-N-acetyl-D-glucosamine dehydrogenase [Syntrophotalea acetylenica]APG43554.1 UDP-N-acetyl-D-glucosamine dehydrogenase [Syntrophotalea acetylenica]MDD4456579.1 Gfo/Idh/MocA family oxidoreductase [Syntrophotalea acetylenica]
MSALRAAVIGVGYLGRFHAQKYAALTDVELVGVADVNREAAERVAAEVGCAAYADYRELLDRIDVVSIVVPTRLHFAVAREFLAAGRHVLVEKPITETVDEADELIAVARQQGVLLQVGHLERFNPAIVALNGELHKPMFIESHRLTPFRGRGTDVNVVLDLMIHDIDIILNMVQSELVAVHASGVPVLSHEVDIANARLEFASGCVANVTASRVSRDAMRKVRVFQSDGYFSIDYQKRRIAVCRKGGDGMALPGLPGITMKEKGFAESDALRDEIAAFVAAVRTGTSPVVAGEDGRRALAVALQISSCLGGILPG